MTEIKDHIYRYRHYIGVAAAVLLVCQQVYHRIFRIPKNLRHLPAIPYGKQLKALQSQENLISRTQRLVFPLLPKAHGVYLNRMPFQWTIYVADPEIARIVFFKPEFANKTSSVLDSIDQNTTLIEFVGNDNVSIVNGHHWKDQRKIMNPAFHRATPVGMFGSLMPKVFRLVEEQPTVPVLELMQKLTLDALGKSVFGFDFGGLDDPDSVWVKTYRLLFDGFTNVIPLVFPRLDGLYRYFSAKRRAQHDAVYKLIDLLDGVADKKRSMLQDDSNSHNDVPEHEKDLLQLMLEAELRGEGNWTKKELRHNMAIFFVAGHDTTSHALTFCLYLLAMNQDIQKKAREEILRVLGDEPKDVFPTLEDCKKLDYLDMVIKESMRIYPPANDILARDVHEDLNVKGIFIPKGAMVSVDIQALHHRPDLWHEPEKFNPDRFLPGGEHDSHEGIAYAPFSSGARQCIALKFSIMQQRVVLAMLLRKFEWELPKESKHKDGIQFEIPFNLAPKDLELIFHKRY
ncbi:cytochrome p450 [Lichtheimia corymbifera JMRC:FSU:9682]|uniref:Cytochrome p450 n=1 Tax=Lichtheimia corymbifera JMRC:FSU:9682 TaxID=1263082 RepID=A0A068RKI7_9FUNG|nr:cytochrome p450 [Lichtheimia corymbifera JMRC:FSU:9682]